MKRKCPDQGTLLGFLDHELDKTSQQQIKEHVAACRLCQERLRTLQCDKELVYAKLAVLAPAQTAVPPLPDRSRQLRTAPLSPVKQLLAILKTNLKLALAILGMLLVAVLIREKITMKTDSNRYGSEPYILDSLSVRYMPHDSSRYAQWLKSVDDTTLIKLMLKSKGDATVVHL